MKRTVLISFLALVLSASYVQAQMGQGMMGGGSQEEYSEQPQGNYPCMTGYGRGMGYGRGYGRMGGGMGSGMGPDMMGGYGMGRGMGYGMMRGCGMGYGMMGGYGMGCGMMGGLCNQFTDPDQFNKFLDDTVDLRKKIHDKMFQYQEATRNPKSTVGSLDDMEKEIYNLRNELYEKAQKYQESK